MRRPNGWQNRPRRFSIPNLMFYITTAMLCVYILDYVLRLNVSQYLYLSRPLILSGQVWRLITFILVPPYTSPLWLVFVLYFYYSIGTALERAWGSQRFNLYYLCGIGGAILAALITGSASNTYLNLSLFLAFAQLFPNQEFLLFFVLPVKAKYLAYADWVLFAFSFIRGGAATRVTILAALLNFFLFFGRDIMMQLRRWWKYRRNGSNDYWSTRR